MTNYEVRANIRVVFGDGALNELPTLLERHHPKSILLVSSGDYVDDLGIGDAVRQAADSLGATLIEDRGVVPNPRLEHVRELIETAKAHNVDFLLAAGGGSAVDTAKSVAIGLAAPEGTDVWDYFTVGHAVEQVPTLKVGVINTLPGTGSEVGRSAVLTNLATKEKFGVEANNLRPVFTIVDPAFSRTVPQHFQAAAIADEIAHLIETYTADDTDVDITDRLLEGALAGALTNAAKYADDPADDNARKQLHQISLYQHYLNFDRNSDWAGHPIEHVISGDYDLLHGEGLAIVTVAWLRFIAAHKPTKLVQLVSRLYHVDAVTFSEEQVVRGFADHLEALYGRLGLPTKLSAYGIGQEGVDIVAAKVTAGGARTVGNYYALSQEDVRALLSAAL
ncbi:iron-containing alcohol dehydrogenase [Bifidobacterium parmae]|uniref:Iron-containing alcohol dehydrogenase n=1 Tax=Bifidobacterium parmae TaxID=361854 RepID=A0A2N5J588_9BIFI|nr:iron-containing alcohol dehydrogenase [Bifidobacterium parmae]PLS29353.1 iron-containing alcohol dehydrogenase [Bifidobacterium parmae]